MQAPTWQLQLPFPAGSGRLWLSVLAVLATILVWALVTTQRTANESQLGAGGLVVEAETVRSVAYVVPGEREDVIRIRALDGGGPPKTIAAIPHALGLHARGAASPAGQLLGVLSVGAPRASATFSLISTADGSRRDVEGAFDYLSALAWSADGGRVALVRSEAPDSAGRIDAHIFEVATSTTLASELASFERVLEAAPVGYRSGGELLVAVVDQSGSALWAVTAEGTEFVAALSAGRTLSWRLDRDGSRLAYVELSGPRGVASGRTLLLRTGEIVREPGAAGAHIGVAWPPNAATASFGGPGGTLVATAAGMSGTYVVPHGWSPDGTTLAATLVISQTDGSFVLSPELVTPSSRQRLADEPDARFLGWVANQRDRGSP